MDRIRNWLRGKPPVKRREQGDWDRQYSQGQWELLASMEEMAHYWVAAGYCGTVSRPSILDIGCGPGLMEEKLRLLPYSEYLGIDFSIEALKTARRKLPESCGLVCADMTTFDTTRKFDIVVFIEVEWPPLSVPVMRRYTQMLRPGGRMLVSLFDGRNRTATADAWRQIREAFVVEDLTRVENVPSEKRWTIAWISPRP